ncbi:MAG: alpha/beta hydrolase [Alphaproteobacteria bacterium]|nr:alpha/beta hydrolase [Alphaproteobacteria bacterium]
MIAPTFARSLPRLVLPMLLLASALIAAPAQAQAQDAPAPLVRRFLQLPATFDGVVLPLAAMEVRPRGPGPFPLVVLAHGTPGEEALRREYRVDTYTTVAVEFARRGFVALAFLRRGYGVSAGDYAESSGPCGASRYVESGFETARELREVLRIMAGLPHVDRRRALVVGQSAGGFGALALARGAPAQVLGLINFAGGRGHFRERNAVCEPEKLVAAMGAFGQGARVPSLWIYAENDTLYRPALVRQMHRAYRAAGGKAELVMMPASVSEGHALFLADPVAWGATVDNFLARLGLPVMPARPQLVPPPGLSDRARDAFRAYARSPLPNKAFAVTQDGAAVWKAGLPSIGAAQGDVLALCRRSGAQCIVLHAVRDFDDE